MCAGHFLGPKTVKSDALQGALAEVVAVVVLVLVPPSL